MVEYLFKVEFHLTPPDEEPIGRTGEPGIRVAPGEIVTDPPPHLVGTCGPDCAMNGEHGWGVKDGLIEVLESSADGFQGVVTAPVAFTVGEHGSEVIAIAARAWHSSRGTVHHTVAACSLGNNVEPDNRVEGAGALPLCSECKRLTAASEEA